MTGDGTTHRQGSPLTAGKPPGFLAACRRGIRPCRPSWWPRQPGGKWTQPTGSGRMSVHGARELGTLPLGEAAAVVRGQGREIELNL
jgi:hypothetical protein